MANANQELMNRLGQIRSELQDETKRAANLKLLDELLEGEHRKVNSDELVGNFVKKANDLKGRLIQSNDDITPEGSPLVGKLRVIAQNLFEILMIDQRIDKIGKDSSVNLTDFEFLEDVNQLTSSNEKLKKSALVKIFKDCSEFEYRDNSIQIIDLQKNASKKLESIKTSRKEKLTERTDLINQAINDSLTLKADNTNEKSIQHLIGSIQKDSSKMSKDLDKAYTEIENKLTLANQNRAEFKRLGRVKSSIAATPFSGLSRFKYRWNENAVKDRLTDIKKLDGEIKDLKDQQRIVSEARRLLAQTQSRLTSRQEELQRLNDELALRKIQIESDPYYVFVLGKDENIPDTSKMPFGRIYCKKVELGDPNPQPSFEVTLRSVSRNGQVEKQIIPAANLSSNPYNAKDPISTTDKTNILNLLRDRNLIYGEYDPSQIDQDLASVKTLSARVENLKADRDECEKTINLCKQIAADPSAHRGTIETRANYMIRLNALADRQAFDEQKKNYFVEEIIAHNGKVKTNQPQGLEGKIVYRGIHLARNEMNRSTCKTKSGDIVYETRVVRVKKDKEIAVVVDKSNNFNKLTNAEDKKLAAIHFADKLLAKHKPGDPIILKGGANHREFAEYVYTALLLLTAPEPGSNQTPFDPNCIKVKVPGVQTASLYSKFRHRHEWRQKFDEGKDISNHDEFKAYKEAITLNRTHLAKAGQEKPDVTVSTEVHIEMKSP